jgi:hypothetical protein
MIDETTNRLQKESKLVLAERGREEGTLATDLWKKPVNKRIFKSLRINEEINEELNIESFYLDNERGIHHKQTANSQRFHSNAVQRSESGTKSRNDQT